MSEDEFATTESISMMAQGLIARGVDPRVVLVRLLIEATITHARLEEQYPSVIPSLEALLAQAKSMLDAQREGEAEA